MVDTSPATSIRLLGPVELGSPDVLGGAKQRLALTLLALRVGEVVPTEHLIEAMWSGDDAEDPRRALQVHISKLRRALDASRLDASIEHRGGGYILRVEPDAVDVHRFERLIECAAAASDPSNVRNWLDQALQLWRGRPLGALGSQPALRPEVTRLDDLRLRALEARFDADLATGHHDEAAGELAQLTQHHPLREGLWRRLMIALYRSGRQGEALEAYARARRILADELGVDPSPALRELHERILRQDPDLESPRSRRRTSSTTRLPRRTRPGSVAVMPFEVIGGGEGTELLALGIHNDLLTELSRIASLTVISRTSVLAYRGTDTPTAVAADELGVETIVTGTLQRSGSRCRLTVQVLDGQHDVQRWAQSYDRDATAADLFDVQSQLARDIASSLSDELTQVTAVPTATPPTQDLEAYRLVVQGRQQFDLKTEDGFKEAVHHYERAAVADPDYVDAWIGLADALSSMEAYGHADRTVLFRAQQALRRALELAPESAEARTSFGVIHAAHQDGPAALSEFERATAIRPGYADAYNWHSWVSLLVGQGAPALHSARRAVDLDPLSAESHAHLALACAATGDPAEGLTAARRAKRYSPYTTAVLYEGLCLAELGRHEEAVGVLAPLTVAASEVPGVPWAGRGPDATLALCLGRLGRTEDVLHVRDHIDADAFPFEHGLISLAAGEVESATDAFARIEYVTAWPALAIHHFHRDLWRTIEGFPVHADLLRIAERSWNVTGHAP